MLRLNKINKIEDYFTTGNKERETISKRLNKYVAVFDYIDKILIVLSVTSGGISIICFSSNIGAPILIASPSSSLVFSLTKGIIKKLLKKTRNKKKKHNWIVMLGKSKLNYIETLISQELIDSEISLKKLKAITDEKEKYKKMKENIRMMKSQKSDAKKDKLNEEEAKKIESNKIIKEKNGNT